MKNIVILGGTGHIGAYTCDYLKEHLDTDEYRLIVCGKRNVKYFTENGFDYVQVNVCNENDFAKLPHKDVYAVINLAGIMPAAMKGYTPYPYIDINIRGSLNVLEYCRKVDCKRIIVTTTEADLSGYWKPGAVIDADLPPKFDHGSNYGMYIISRRTVIEMLENYKLRYGITPFVIRCSNVYCYIDVPCRYSQGEKIIPNHIQIYNKAINGEPIEIWGDPFVKTDIVYVKDFAQIVYRALLADVSNGGIYNIGTGMPVSLEDQVRIAADVLGQEGKRSEIRYRPDMPTGRDFVMDISKTKRELGYVPKYDYRSYLEDYKKEMEINRYHGLFTDRSEE